jgi:Chromo (CHRromatin Organisation MOdifier) domain
MNIQKLNTSGYRPQTNGMVEKFNHTLVQAISQYISSDQRDWDEFLPFACFQYRSSNNNTTNQTPYYLLFYREMKMPLDRVYSKDEEFQSAEEYLREANRRFRAAKEIFLKQREAIEEDKKQFNDSIRKTVNFEIGEVVLILKRYVKRGQVKKLTHLWKGPYIVVQKFPSGINYEVQLLVNAKDRHVVHASNMKVYTEPHTTHLSKQLQSSEDEEEHQEFEVEAVLDKHQEEGHLYYLVKWKNFDSSANSWEPINNLIHCREMIKQFERQKKESEEKVGPTQQ